MLRGRTKGISHSNMRRVLFCASLCILTFIEVGRVKAQAASDILDTMHNTRNENSTPRNSILPASPAFADPNSLSANGIDRGTLLRSKALLMRLGYSVGRLDGRTTAKFKAAVFKYQKAHKLNPTGDLDPETLKSLTGREQ